MKGLEVDTAMKWLNVSRSYVYRMLRNDELQAVSTKPLLINPNSIIKKIGHTYSVPKNFENNTIDSTNSNNQNTAREDVFDFPENDDMDSKSLYKTWCLALPENQTLFT